MVGLLVDNDGVQKLKQKRNRRRFLLIFVDNLRDEQTSPSTLKDWYVFAFVFVLEFEQAT